jgi:hypothetical protein
MGRDDAGDSSFLLKNSRNNKKIPPRLVHPLSPLSSPTASPSSSPQRSGLRNGSASSAASPIALLGTPRSPRVSYCSSVDDGADREAEVPQQQHICVALNVRPMLPHEASAGASSCIYTSSSAPEVRACSSLSAAAQWVHLDGHPCATYKRV